MKLVDIIIGMQFGSEGKGKIAALLAPQYGAAVRVGAPNAGHSIIHKDVLYKMRSIPCAWVNPKCQLYIGAGGLINLDVLNKELKQIPREYLIERRLRIDINAGVVTQDDIHQEELAGMYEGIGSTCEGIGVAMARKVLRRNNPITAKDVPELQPYMTNVSGELNESIDANVPIMLEGTQGFGLSLNHGYYPYVTSRDVLASSILGECGLAPRTVRRVIGVMRTYPIRVHGNSGPMGADELTWEDVARESGYKSLSEKTTVTGRVRRVSRINWDLLVACVQANKPTEIALMFLDYIDAGDRGKNSWADLSQKSKDFVIETECKLGVPVTILSTGPRPEETIFRSCKCDGDLADVRASLIRTT